mmetsp:Transcript_12624/g.25749  ORF Transcript_12624/g.25749 Transcript_12624/m.25749 type:complete len:210 (+) Transcript_12624:1161-1790(+)
MCVLVGRVQVNVLRWISIVFVEYEAVRFDGFPFLDIDLEVGVISLIDEEFAVGYGTLPTSLHEHVTEGGREVVTPVLSLLPRNGVFIANYIPIRPPVVSVRINVLLPTQILLLHVVRLYGVITLQLDGIAPRVPVILIDKGREYTQLAPLDHYEDTALHVVEEILEGVHRRDGIRRLMEGKVKAVFHCFLDGGGREGVGSTAGWVGRSA